MSEWRDIASAPKDGTWFVAVRAGEDDSYEVGRYDPGYWDKYTEVSDGLYRKTPELIYEWRFNNMHRMTHWMPLPEPPK